MLLITGASGHIGGRVAELLEACGAPLRLMSRTPGKVKRAKGVEIIKGDFEQPETLRYAFDDVDAALIVSGGAKPEVRALTHRNAFQAAARAGVKHIVYLSLKGASPMSIYPYCRDHYRSEHFLAETGVQFTALRMAFYMDMLIPLFGEDGVLRGPAGRGKGAFVSREDAAQAAVGALLLRPIGAIEITGPESLGLAEVARRLSWMSGRELLYEDERALTTREQLSHTAMAPWRQDLSVRWMQALAAGEQEKVSDGYQMLTANAPRTLEQYVEAHPEVIDPLRQLVRPAPRIESRVSQF